MKSIGEENGYYYADWGFIPGSDEFNSLIDGQVFEFHDQIFCTHFKVTKSCDKWIGTNYCIHFPLTMHKEDAYGKDLIPYISIKKNAVNIYALKQLINYESGNPLILMIDKGMLKSVSHCRMGDVWRVWFGCNEDKSEDYSASLELDGHPYEFIVGFTYSWKHDHKMEVKTDNYFDYIPYHYEDLIEALETGLKI